MLFTMCQQVYTKTEEIGVQSKFLLQFVKICV